MFPVTLKVKNLKAAMEGAKENKRKGQNMFKW